MSKQLFDEIAAELQKVAPNTPLMQQQKELKRRWGYSICATPLETELPLVMGMNWGGSGEFEVQSEMPDKQGFIDDLNKGHYRFLTRSSRLLKTYGEIDIWSGNFNYTNFCFFRSPNAKYLHNDDYALSLDILERLIKGIQPSKIICLTTSVISHIPDKGTLQLIQSSGQRTYHAYQGQLFGFPFYCVPHPNAHVPTMQREELWRQCFNM